ncbi:hypothetical protein CD30_03940 [Ureibacillus massiliensis 4400831 = CIP 108448 = CCUG 49529]|uniref:Bile acid:sodium symporter n=1 Tax=Ureibacillus massiliensis 4400831 = CIP 108448 = CCUG 49529 TaxID=1211035 RepID=A0A0A3JXK8_9BACL|nr:bile acid:sodium symporter family protein [Ureibacillus massiliensis]KGR91737.1 hypothetical protein CD30_03940 [Ureibacillus massiliensis 4400831 = CIP 108448 = CCUG 49529]
MLEQINSRLQKLMPVLTPLSLVIGVFLEEVGSQVMFLVPWIFAFMTLASSLSLNLQGLKSFIKYPWVILASIAFLHILMPLWAYLVSSFFFHDQFLTLGFILSVAVPTGVTSFIWISICKGHLTLGLSIILIDTLIAPLVMPTLVHIVVGQAVEIDTLSLMVDLLWMIVLPSIVGLILNEYTKGRIEKTLGKTLAPFQKISLFLIVMINSSVIAPYLKNITWDIIAIILVVLFISISGYVFCLVTGHFLWREESIVTSFVFAGGMRNIAVGVVIASTYFPAKVAMPVVFGMMFQQVLAAQFSRVIEIYKEKYTRTSVEAMESSTIHKG